MNAREYLEAALGYRFRSPEPLTRALCHSSWINEHPDDGLVSNQRLEFLGDAVLNLVVSHLLMERYPSLTEGELSRTRAYLVNESQLAAIARQIGLGPCLLLGKGEAQSDGRKKNSILADGVEAHDDKTCRGDGFLNHLIPIGHAPFLGMPAHHQYGGKIPLRVERLIDIGRRVKPGERFKNDGFAQ